MKRIHKILVGTAGALTLAVVTAVAAAPDGPVGPFYGRGGMGFGMGGPGMMHGYMGGGQPGAYSAQYLDQMKAKLIITAQQEPAWQAFAAKAAEQVALMQAMHAQHFQAPNADTSAPDRMNQHIGLMTQRLAGMQAMNVALTDLYAVLTPQQRNTADLLFGSMGSRGRGWGWGMHY